MGCREGAVPVFGAVAFGVGAVVLFFCVAVFGADACGAAFWFAVLGVRVSPLLLEACEPLEGCAFFFDAGRG